jgi:iron complex transport system ATP-binding protein
LLQVDSVSFSYARSGRAPARPDASHGSEAFVVNGVSLRIGRGGIVGLLGPNGSGKTTLMRIMAGLLKPSSGAVTLDEHPVRALTRRELARHIALVPQETQTTFDHSVLDMVLMGRYPHLGPFALEGPDDLVLAREALAATGTAHLHSRTFGTLSGGEKQRVVIAGALAQASEILLLDEPTASLDLGYQFEIAALLRRLNRERGTTMVLSTHDLNLAAALCDRVVLLKQGRVLAEGSTIDTLTAEHVQHLYGVSADVRFHERAGHLTVVPLARQQ